MMKLRCNSMLRAVCASQKQHAITMALSRKLHCCTCRSEAITYLPGHSLYSNNQFRGRLLESCVIDRHNLLRHWESTANVNEFDMNKDLRCVQVNACSDLYHGWYDMDVNRKMPLNGVDFDVVYFDSKPRAPSHIPVILALHGTAGSHLNFASIVPILMQSKARIIIPNFPGCGFTSLDKGKAFFHTDQERASFILDFLNTVGISRVDVLIAHSAAIYPALYCLDDITTFKSVVFLNPAGHKPIKSLQPVWFYQIVVNLFNNSLFRPLARLLTPIFAPNMKLGLEELEIAAKSLVFVNFEYVVKKLKELKLISFPMIFSYAMNDNMFDAKTLDEMTQILEFSPEDIVRYNAEGRQIQTPVLEVGKQRSLCIIFESGGHFVMNAYPEIVGKAIMDLLEWIRSKPAVVVAPR